MALRDRIQEILKADSWMTASEVWVALDEADLNRGSVQQALREMAAVDSIQADKSRKQHRYRLCGMEGEPTVKARPPTGKAHIGSLHESQPTVDQGAELAARLHQIFEEIERLKQEKLEIIRRLARD